MKVLGSLIFVAFILILPQNLLAHRVNLFALVEGQVIQGKSKFSNAKPAKQAKILVYNLVTKELLLDLKTNDEGEFSFQVPEIAPSSGLLLKVDAGEGHQ
ncbi:MAG: hypothetical protein IJU40_03480, partial [Desulfovibrionaceae bacterium]|nr:hypothetical protein [Desulfovibrionaceae bacterium]